MLVEDQITIKATNNVVWQVVTDIENAARVFKDIKSIAILEKPRAGIRGLKWKEVRTFLGKEATETMWITHVEEKIFYTAEARNSGCLYHSTIHLQESDAGILVRKSFQSTPESLIAKLMSPLLLVMKGSLQKCIARDLRDLKSYLEANAES